MNYSNILLEQPDAGIHLLTVNRPKSLNALNADTLDEIASAIAQVADDKAVRVLLVTGAGDKAFVAGADIAQMQGFGPADAQAFSEKGNRTFRMLEMLPFPAAASSRSLATGSLLPNAPRSASRK